MAMDIFLDVLLLCWFLIACFVVYGAFISSESEDWGWGSKVFSTLLFVFLLILILNNFLGNEIIEGKVYAVSKIGSDEKVMVKFSKSVEIEIEPSEDILKSYEVAIYPVGSTRLRILKNNNNLWRLKFNKREIQLQIEPDNEYRFRVHRWFMGKNILDIEEKR